MHSTGEEDHKLRQDRGFPKQNPAAGWIKVLGTFYLISSRSQTLSKRILTKYSEDLGSKNYQSRGQLQRLGKDLVLQLSNWWWLYMETYPKYKSQVRGDQETHISTLPRS